MNKIGFDNKKYLSLQSEKIEERINSIKQDLSLMSEKVDDANKKSNKAIMLPPLI